MGFYQCFPQELGLLGERYIPMRRYQDNVFASLPVCFFSVSVEFEFEKKIVPPLRESW